MLILIAKIIVTPIALVSGMCNVIVAFLLWDDRPMDEHLLKIVWSKKN